MSPERGAEIEAALWRVRHMIEAVEHIREFLGTRDVAAFVMDLQCVYAVRAAFSMMGEAASKVPESIRGEFPEIEWREIRGFRNFIVHVYDQVDPVRLHQTVEVSLPGLLERLRAMVGVLEAERGEEG